MRKAQEIRTRPETPAPVARRPRFRIEKLEERVAPRKGGNGTNNCATGNCASDTWGSSIY
jgi:hypothetical protein